MTYYILLNLERDSSASKNTVFPTCFEFISVFKRTFFTVKNNCRYYIYISVVDSLIWRQIVVNGSSRMTLRLKEVYGGSWLEPSKILDYSLFNSILKPFGWRVFSRFIQKSSLPSSILLISVIDLFCRWSCSMMVNFASLLKLCVFELKCWHTLIASSRVTSSRCLLILMFVGYSLFPTYCILHLRHSKR